MGDTSKLKKWQPGQSGNPNGRPPRASLKKALGDMLLENAPEAIIEKIKEKMPTHTRTTNADALAAILIMKSYTGDMGAMRLVKDLTDSFGPQEEADVTPIEILKQIEGREE